MHTLARTKCYMSLSGTGTRFYMYTTIFLTSILYYGVPLVHVEAALEIAQIV